MSRPALLVFPVLWCWLGCGPAAPLDDGGLDAGVDAGEDAQPDGDADDVIDAEVGDGDVDVDSGDGGAGDPCEECPDSCVLGRCAEDTCALSEHVAVSAALPHDGPLVALDIEGRWLYALDRFDGPLVFDATDPERLELVASLSMPEAFGIDVVGDRAYVQAGAELHVVDVTDPAAPAAGASVPVWGSEVRVFDDVLVVSGADRVQLFDLTDRDAPTMLAELPLPETEHGADRTKGTERIGSTLLVGAESGGLAVVDISVPGAPALLDVIALESEVNDIVLDGEGLVVATNGGLRAFDIGDPTAPVETARFAGLEGPRAESVVPWGDALLSIAGQATLVEGAPPTASLLPTPGYVTDAATTPGWAFLSTSDQGLLSIPLEAREDLATRLSIEEGAASALALHGGRLFLGLGDDGLEVWDLASLPEVHVLGSLSTPAHRLLVAGELLAVSAGTELVLVDAESLDVFSTVPVPQVGHSLATTISAMSMDGSLLFVGARALTDGLLWTLDVTEPSSPEVVYSEAVGGADEPVTLVASDEVLYVVHEGRGAGRLSAYDVSEPRAPFEVGRVETEDLSFVNDMALHGSHLFVAASTLVVFDVSDPSAPRSVGGWEGRALALEVDGSLLYTADYAHPRQGMNVLDVTDPTSPAFEMSHPLEFDWPSLRASVVAAARFALVATGTPEVTMIPVCR